ncbi:MAG: CoA transferase, partial [Dehalococcoidia bacterium]
GWIEERTVAEVVEIMNAAQVGCSPVMTAENMAKDPHYQTRQVHLEWEDLQLGRKVKGVGIAPKLSLTPGKVWRGSVPLGYDNQQVYQELLGLASVDLDRLSQQGVI